jgi:hypothetical protein
MSIGDIIAGFFCTLLAGFAVLFMGTLFLWAWNDVQDSKKRRKDK